MTSDLIQEMSESRLRVVVTALAVTVVTLVAFLILFPGVLSFRSMDVSYAPKFHAFLNGATAILLSIGYIAVRRKKFTLHRSLMLSAFALSCVFLVSYVVYHSQKTEPTHFGAEGFIRMVYFTVLITHIVLAAGIVPLALFTIARSWRGEYKRHRRIARITFPLWLYVTVSGVLVYLMLYVWFPST